MAQAAASDHAQHDHHGHHGHPDDAGHDAHHEDHHAVDPAVDRRAVALIVVFGGLFLALYLPFAERRQGAHGGGHGHGHKDSFSGTVVVEDGSELVGQVSRDGDLITVVEADGRVVHLHSDRVQEVIPSEEDRGGSGQHGEGGGHGAADAEDSSEAGADHGEGHDDSGTKPEEQADDEDGSNSDHGALPQQPNQPTEEVATRLTPAQEDVLVRAQEAQLSGLPARALLLWSKLYQETQQAEYRANLLDCGRRLRSNFDPIGGNTVAAGAAFSKGLGPLEGDAEAKALLLESLDYLTEVSIRKLELEQARAVVAMIGEHDAARGKQRSDELEGMAEGLKGAKEHQQSKGKHEH